ncbi:MAG: hypothetical protein ABSB69_19195, partial [Solirubrobacteraceae bacterium]
MTRQACHAAHGDFLDSLVRDEPRRCHGRRRAHTSRRREAITAGGSWAGGSHTVPARPAAAPATLHGSPARTHPGRREPSPSRLALFRSVNIALVNELAMLTDRMGIDIWEVVDAASTKPYGFMRFEPGPGMGGHCLPVDPFYLSWRAREFDMSLELVELSGKVNQQMPYHCVAKVQRTLNRAGLPVKGARIA